LASPSVPQRAYLSCVLVRVLRRLKRKQVCVFVLVLVLVFVLVFVYMCLRLCLRMFVFMYVLCVFARMQCLLLNRLHLSEHPVFLLYPT